jgi:hypothetical protein
MLFSACFEQETTVKAKELGLPSLPLLLQYHKGFPNAHHIPLIMEACPRQVVVLISLLNTYADLTRLRVTTTTTTKHFILKLG